MNQQQSTQTGSNQNSVQTYHINWGKFKSSWVTVCTFYRVLSTSIDMNPWIYEKGQILINPKFLDENELSPAQRRYFVCDNCNGGVVELAQDELAMLHATKSDCDVQLEGLTIKTSKCCHEDSKCQKEHSEGSQ